jgi:hypothetical protein
MTKKELLRIVWDAYNTETIPATFEDLFARNGELRSDLDAHLGDGLLTFILREIWETVDDEDPQIMVQSAIVSMDRAVDDMLRVQNALGTWKPS